MTAVTYPVPKTIADLDAVFNDFTAEVNLYNSKLKYLDDLKDQMNLLEKDANAYELILYNLKYGT
jgi:hypothetical protein